MDYTLRWKQNKYNWNGQWSGTRSAIDGEMKNGFGGVTNFNYNSKHFGVFGHYDYFNSTFKNSDLGFFSSRNNKTQVNGGFYVSNPDPGKKLFRSVNVQHELLHAVQRRLAAARQELLRRRRRPVPELLEFLPRHRPLLADLRRPRHARRSADRQARRLVRRFVRRHRFAQAHPAQHRRALQRQRRRRLQPQRQHQPQRSSRGRRCRCQHQHRHHRRPRHGAVDPERGRHRRRRRPITSTASSIATSST